MPTLKEIEAEVDELKDVTANIFTFRKLFTRIEEASQTDVDTASLADILEGFRQKIPDLIAFNRIRADARDLDENLMIDDVAARIQRIQDRNELLKELSGQLDAQIEKANNDANLLRQIKSRIDKATATLNEIRSLINQLSATDASTRDQLLTLVQSLGNISSILNPAQSE
jgi:hypothetical protein